MISNNFDDVPILDVTMTDDENVSLISGNIQDSTDHEAILIPSTSHFRPTNIVRTLVFVEFLSVLIIWLLGIFD
jgi:hypothetical protein